MYTFNYNISEEDYYEFILYESRNRLHNRKGINLYRYICFLLYMLIATILAFTSKNYILPCIYFGAAAYMLWRIFRIRTQEYTLRKSVERMQKDGKRLYSESGTLIFNNEHIIDSSSVSETKIPYSSISRIAQGKSATYVYYNSSRPIIVPFSVFDGDKVNLEFHEYIMQKTNLYPVLWN